MSNFVAINRIYCREDYRQRFEQLFATRAHAIDRMPGFLGMQVLRPQREGEPYLVVSFWESKEAFEAWTGSPEFLEGHRRGFEDVRRAREQGQEPPMRSEFVTYDVIAR
ncbi:MAG: hypothetical protein KatS3mg038_2649 [Candidatus Kapaibacterium sp.]|nr:MAG: hypothetical protein KatS3mg038_2649 [Candidatus Kapabacteria bacterium]GIV55829.1 MAG: hypothetical protein KatS3mg040_0597 [Candidatus Kapabacteria bacterium]